MEEALRTTPRVEALLAQARKPAEEALRLHPVYRGKLEVTLKCPITDLADFAIWYSPGVAAPCRDIAQHPERVWAHTDKGNCIAIVTDGTRVLGLGDIGPTAALPVMEGKAILFKYLGGVDALPLCLATKDPDDIIQACKWLEPSFGGINLEDIATPKCFYILERLREELHIPVWHDDQQGTAAVMLAGLMNALMVDTKGILHQGREGLRTPENLVKWHFCEVSNGEGRRGGMGHIHGQRGHSVRLCESAARDLALGGQGGGR